MGCIGLRLLAEPLVGGGPPYVFGILAALISGALFDMASGFVAVTLAAMMTAFFVFPPRGSLLVDSLQNLGSIVMFVGAGGLSCLLVETMHRALEHLQAALERLQAALDKLARTERRHGLLLVEFRHRSRNDLASIGAMLLLRARVVTEANAKHILREAAGHTTTLARIHNRLENAAYDADDVAFVDTQAFIVGLCRDLIPPIVGVVAEAHALPTERAVQLGLLLAELAQDARHDVDATVLVRFDRCGGDFVLRVADDCGAGHADTMRTKMVTLMARQLRGTYSRDEKPAGGTVAMVRFPVEAPTLAPGQVGR